MKKYKKGDIIEGHIGNLQVDIKCENDNNRHWRAYIDGNKMWDYEDSSLDDVIGGMEEYISSGEFNRDEEY